MVKLETLGNCVWLMENTFYLRIFLFFCFSSGFSQKKRKRKKIKLASFFIYFLSVYLTCLHPKWEKNINKKIKKDFPSHFLRKASEAEERSLVIIRNSKWIQLRNAILRILSRTQKNSNEKRIRIILIIKFFTLLFIWP